MHDAAQRRAYIVDHARLFSLSWWPQQCSFAIDRFANFDRWPLNHRPLPSCTPKPARATFIASESRMLPPIARYLHNCCSLAYPNNDAACVHSARTELADEHCCAHAEMGSQDRQKLANSHQRLHSEAVVLSWQEFER
jgi:hypothetical protein